MGYFEHLLTSKGLSTAARRLRALLRQVGPTTTRMRRTLDAYLDVTAAYHVRPTFPTPAVVVDRHPRIIRHLVERGAEIAIHGLDHVDYARLPPEEQVRHMREAVRRFQSRKIPFYGFRAPYLRWDGSLLDALRSLRIGYDSSAAVFWKVLKEPLTPEAEARLQRVLDFYAPLSAEEEPVLPFWERDVLRLPVSLPDDEILVDRLGSSAAEIGEVWQRILALTHRRGELFVLQLHPERFFICREGLNVLLNTARSQNPPVWIAPLAEIAQWWRRKSSIHVSVSALGPRLWRIQVSGRGQVGLLVRGASTDPPGEPWHDPWDFVSAQDVRIHSPARPTIGVAPNTHPQVVRFLRDLGYIVENACADHVVLIEERTWSSAVRGRLLSQLRESHVPQVRLNPWPGPYRSALAITGDLDVLTWWDVLSRVR